MYSNEIAELLKIRNYLITIEEYIKITNSPQIDHVKFENGNFYLWTNDNYKFVLRIKN